jgi:hypothetical protein
MKTVEFKRYSQKECDYHCTCDLYEEEHPDHSGIYVLASEANKEIDRLRKIIEHGIRRD